MKQLHYVLKELREKNHYSQQKIADMLNISQQAYAHYENNKRNPNINILMKLAEIYDVSLDRLSGRYENTKNNENKEFKKKI